MGVWESLKARYGPRERVQHHVSYVKTPVRDGEDPLVPVTMFEEWVKRLWFAGIPGAVRYTLVDGEWRDERLDRGQRLLNRAGLNYKIRKRGERFEAWVQDV